MQKKLNAHLWVLFLPIAGLLLNDLLPNPAALVPIAPRQENNMAQILDTVAAVAQANAELPLTWGEHHMGSGNCVLCHGTDPNAMQDTEGNDVNVIDTWSATMMANSAKDPFWQAKVAHEQLVNPGYAEEIATVCTKCHAPAGHHEAIWAGAEHYGMADLAQDSLGRDGVTCTACHLINDDNLANRFNGDLPYNEDRIIWGPINPQVTMPMQMHVDYTPTQGEHFLSSDVCAACHSLYTHTFDLEGEPTGDMYFEQTTFKEWQNSTFSDQNITCQACHMPLLDGGTVLSDRPAWLAPNRYGQHHLVGGNKVMLTILRDNAQALGVTATEAAFDSSIARTDDLLRNHTANLSLTHLPEQGLAAFEVEVANLAGHKYPSGYPSRLAFLEFVVTDGAGNELFRSGGWSPDGGVTGRDTELDPLTFEPHHQTITSENQVQVYETVFADVSGTPTTILDRAHSLLKDNRLPPLGFDPDHISYDTTAFGPAAAADLDFNMHADGTSGSGSDRLVYNPDLGTFAGDFTVELTLWHLTLPRAWAEPMFDLASNTQQTEENAGQIQAIALFQSLFDDADRTPIPVAHLTWHSDPGMGVAPLGAPDPRDAWRLLPNPARDRVQLEPAQSDAWSTLATVQLIDGRGRLVRELSGASVAAEGLVTADLSPGVFFVQLIDNLGGSLTLRGLKND